MVVARDSDLHQILITDHLEDRRFFDVARKTTNDTRMEVVISEDASPSMERSQGSARNLDDNGISLKYGFVLRHGKREGVLVAQVDVGVSSMGLGVMVDNQSDVHS